MKKSVKILGRTIPVAVLALLLISGIGMAALLTYYGTITTRVDVEQIILVDGHDWNVPIETETIPEAAPGGEEFCYLHKIKNKASIDVPIDFKMSCTDTGDQTPEICEGITETIYEVSETTTLNLCAKDTSWTCTVGPSGILTFDTIGPTFKGTLKTTALSADTNYVLVYYKDFDPRFDTWNDPGKVYKIVGFTGAEANAGLEIDVNLNMNLPSADDWNINPDPDYCGYHNGFDNYEHCKGAKLWVIHADDYDDIYHKLLNWHPVEFLFEEDLIVYSDCDLSPETFAVDMERGSSITHLDTLSNTTTPVLVCYSFDKLIAPGRYTITTNVVPSQ